MPLPLIPIAAGIAARYGAKKLAKALVKRNTKKLKKSYKAYVESDGPYGEPGMKPMGGVAKSAKAFVKLLEKKGQTVYTKAERTKAPYKASQERKVRGIQGLRKEVTEANRMNQGFKPDYKLPRYTVKRPRNK
jgi:hypothetical protein